MCSKWLKDGPKWLPEGPSHKLTDGKSDYAVHPIVVLLGIWKTVVFQQEMMVLHRVATVMFTCFGHHLGFKGVPQYQKQMTTNLASFFWGSASGVMLASDGAEVAPNGTPND